MDRLNAMSLLLDTVDAGSFSAAARKRGMSVATLTRQIGQLEHYLGAVLLLRTTRRLTLTDAGRDYVEGARAIIRQVHSIEREAAGEFLEPTGRLVISAPRLLGRLHVLPVVTEFLRDHPGITIDLRLTDENVDLATGDADLAVRIGPLPDSNLIATRVGEMRTVIVASPSLLNAHGPVSTVDDLRRMPEIRLDIPLPGASTRPSWVDSSMAPQVRLIVSGPEAAVDAAEAGIGFVRLLHYQALDALRAGRLELTLARHEPPAQPVHLVHAPHAQLPQKMRKFLDFSKERLRGALAVDTGGNQAPA